MGYDAHITRREHWADPNSGAPITRQEFDQMIRTDPQFAEDPENRPDLVIWKSGGDQEAPQWLCWSEEGEIYSKSPPEEFIPVMVAIARKLGAKVQGDDGEEYGEDGQPILEAPPAHSAPMRQGLSQQQRRKNLLIANSIALVVVAAILVLVRMLRH